MFGVLNSLHFWGRGEEAIISHFHIVCYFFYASTAFNLRHFFAVARAPSFAANVWLMQSVSALRQSRSGEGVRVSCDGAKQALIGFTHHERSASECVAQDFHLERKHACNVMSLSLCFDGGLFVFSVPGMRFDTGYLAGRFVNSDVRSKAHGYCAW